jgi:dihydroflavonol-4-reductase
MCAIGQREPTAAPRGHVRLERQPRRPSREGTLRVLRASLDAGVERVVVTSSIAAITGGLQPTSRPLTEDDWSDPDNPRLTPYARSKTIAERAAWDLVRERGETEKLAVVNPGAILGPVLSDDRSYSIRDDRAAADGNARGAADRLQHRRRS